MMSDSTLIDDSDCAQDFDDFARESKSCGIAIKSVEDSTREITAIVSVFNIPDLYGDIVRPGFFKESLKSYRSTARPNLPPLPMIFAHGDDNIANFVGEWTDSKELLPGDPLLPSKLKDLGGLWLKGYFDDDEDSTKLYRNVKGGRIRQFSFAFRTLKHSYIETDGKLYRELQEGMIFEAGPCLIGVNTHTQPLSVKAQGGVASNGSKTLSRPPVDPTLTIALLKLNLLTSKGS